MCAASQFEICVGRLESPFQTRLLSVLPVRAGTNGENQARLAV